MADYKPIDYSVYPQILCDYGHYKTVVQNRSVNTVSDYLSDLRLFFRYLIAVRAGSVPTSLSDIDISSCDLAFVASIKKSEIYAFLGYMADIHSNHASTRARKLSAIRSFFRYLTVSEGTLKTNPAQEIDGPQIHAALPKFLSLDESRTLLQTVQADSESKTRVRDFAIITLFLNCGMRLSELVGISLPDIDREIKTVRITGKGSKQRLLYLNSACRTALQAYLSERLSQAAHPDAHAALFLSSRMRRISQKTVQWIVYKYLDAAGFGNRGLSVHKLRHTAATLMYQYGGVDVRVLKEILGHEQMNTTQIYTHVSNEQMEQAMEQNPLSDPDKNSGKNS